MIEYISNKLVLWLLSTNVINESEKPANKKSSVFLKK